MNATIETQRNRQLKPGTAVSSMEDGEPGRIVGVSTFRRNGIDAWSYVVETEHGREVWEAGELFVPASKYHRASGLFASTEYDRAAAESPEGLMFEHGDFEEPIGVGDGLQDGPRKTRRREKKTEEEEKTEDRAETLERKRQKTQGTPNKDYLDHANQCGYLLKNIRLDFLKSPEMRTTSVKMRIHNLTPDQLKRFTDAAGEKSLAALSTHEKTKTERDSRETKIYSPWTGFALAVIDFLDIAVDVDGLAARHRDVGGDTGFLPLEKWGVSKKSVLEQLTNQRPDIDAEEIRKAFTKGYGGGLAIGGKREIIVRF